MSVHRRSATAVSAGWSGRAIRCASDTRVVVADAEWPRRRRIAELVRGDRGIANPALNVRIDGTRVPRRAGAERAARVTHPVDDGLGLGRPHVVLHGFMHVRKAL